MKIDFINLKAQYHKYKNQIDKAINQILESSSFIQCKIVEETEQKLAKYIGSKHCITCGSGTDALLLSLLALDIKQGDEIITTSFAFFAVAEVIALLGAVPVFIDIEENTFNIDVSKIEEKVTKKTKAIIPVSLFGQPADIEEINSIAKKYNLFVIEDSAQSFGAIYKKKSPVILLTLPAQAFIRQNLLDALVMEVQYLQMMIKLLIKYVVCLITDKHKNIFINTSG